MLLSAAPLCPFGSDLLITIYSTCAGRLLCALMNLAICSPHLLNAYSHTMRTATSCYHGHDIILPVLEVYSNLASPSRPAVSLFRYLTFTSCLASTGFSQQYRKEGSFDSSGIYIACCRILPSLNWIRRQGPLSNVIGVF